MTSEGNENANLITPEVIEDTPLESEDETGRNIGRCCLFIKNITMEPCIFLFYMAISMEGPIFAEIMLEKTCLVYFNYSTSVCANLTDHKEEQVIAQQQANRFIMAYNILKSIPTILFVLFLGPWSDKHGRKIPLVLPFIGSAASAALMWANAHFWNLQTEFILIAVIPVSLTGGLTCLIMSMYSYISDISEIRNRTVRIAFFDTFVLLGSSFGLLLSNATKATIGFEGTYIVIGSAYILAAIYIVTRIEETRGQNARCDLQSELAPKSGTKLKDLFDCDNIRQTFVTTFEKRPNFGRTKVVLLMASLCFMIFVFNAMEKEFYYTKLKFNWLYDDFIYWIVATMLISFIGIAAIFPVLTFKLGIRDEFLGLAGCLSVIINYLIMAFAIKGYQMYIASGVGILSGIPLAVNRSMISKIVPENITGKVFSVLASWESFLPLVAAPIYTYTYNSTVHIFPGMFIIVSSICYMFCAVVLLIIYILNRREIVGLVVEV